MTLRRYGWQIWCRVWRFRGDFVLGLLATLLSAAVALLLPERFKILFEQVFPSGDIGLVARQLGVLLGLVTVSIALSSLRRFMMERLSLRLTTSARGELFGHLLSVSPRRLTGAGGGQIVSTFSNDLQVYLEAVRTLLAVTVPSAILLAIYAAAMVWYSWALTLVLMVLVVPMVLATTYFGRRIHISADEAQTRLGDLMAQLEEVLHGLKEIKLFAMEARVGDGFGALNRQSLRALLSRELLSTLHPFIVSITVALGLAGIILASVWLLSTGWIVLGDLTGFVVCLGLAYPAIQELSHSFGKLVQLFTVMDRIAGMLALPPERGGIDLTVPFRGDGEISFEAVGFAYRPGEAAQVLDLTLNVAAGERVAIVGPSGAGKSTLLELLPRFLELDTGRIAIGGVDIARLHLPVLRARIGLVLQVPFLFAGTLMDNLKVGAPDASDAEVLAVAHTARVDEFAARMPDGYATRIDTGGSNLSVGQRQRIAIARVLLKDPPILLFDEPTSALDSDSERYISEAIRDASINRTTIIVAHRLSTVRDVDRVIVIDKGHVVEQGSHEALIRLNGTYARLARKSALIGET